MTILFATALFALALGIVTYPLLRPSHRALRRNGHEPASLADLLEQRERIYADLVDLELDRGLGTLGQADYDELSRRYRRQALAILKALHAAGTAVSAPPRLADDALADEIEREIARRRAVKPAAPPPIAVDGGRIANPAARRWATVLGLATVVVLVGISSLYLSSRRTIESQTPVATVTAVSTGPMVVIPGKGVLLVTADGLLASADDGRTWQPRDRPGLGPVRLLAASPASATVYAIAGDRLLASADGGVTWSDVPTDLPIDRVRALAASPSDARLLYAVVAPNLLFRSPDGGKTWMALGAALPDDVVDLVVQPGSSPFLFAASPSRGVLRAAADGKTWEAASGTVNLAIVGRVRRLAIVPQTGTLFAGTDEGLFRSETGGTEWVALPYRGDVVAIGVDPVRAGMIYVVDGRGQVFRSSDRGTSWNARE